MKKEKGGIWMYMGVYGYFINNFWELGDPNQKSFFGRGGVYFYFLGVSEGDPVFLERGGVG